jgi:protoporphyrinogen oxidase
MYTILGAGLSGISVSYHIGHEHCLVFEKNSYTGGHIHSYKEDDFVWDEGPHVSFTRNEYVKKLLEFSVDHKYLEYPVKTANFYKGHWIPHPAQSNLYAVPQPLRDSFFEGFLHRPASADLKPKNYEEWLLAAFGESFYQEFPKAYTKKYWTVEPSLLSTAWVGPRVFSPSLKEVKAGYENAPGKETHYITKVRYPLYNGYYSYATKLVDKMNTLFDKEITYISFKEKYILFGNERHDYENLIATIPLPELISKSDAPLTIKESAAQLACTSVLLVNVIADHATLLDYNWMYVYDDNKFSTRINCTEKLSTNNGPANKSGIQVEVYFSKYKPVNQSFDDIAKKVCEELIEMGLIKDQNSILSYHTKWVEWANVIFDHNREQALDVIFDWLSQFGLERNEQDLLPMTDWDTYKNSRKGTIHLAGRFAEWKYYWTDDCILRGQSLKTN